MSESADEINPSVRSLFTSRLEMVEAHQSRLTLPAPEEAPGSAVPFFLPMVLEFSGEGTMAREETEEEDE
jgi:hypothetical protein